MTPTPALLNPTDSTPDETLAGSSPFQNKIASLDEKIAWHYEQISVLKAERNALPPIHRLPNELLALVLVMYAIESESLSTLKWTKTMLVCRRWYDLALVPHALWGHIDLGWNRNPSRLRLQLERSGVAPLEIKVLACDNLRYTRAIFDNSSRVESVELAGEAKYIHHFVHNLDNHIFPCLRSLCLEPGVKEDDALEEPVLALPDSVFEGGMPCLRELKLRSIHVPWGTLRDLEGLSLTGDIHFARPGIPTFTDLLAMLRACPQLRDLTLDFLIPSLTLDVHHDAVELPFLTSMSLRAPLADCTALLNHLSFPATATITLYPGGIHAGADAAEILIPVRKHVRAPSSPPSVLLRIACQAGRERAGFSHFNMGVYPSTAPPKPMDPATLSLNSHPTDGDALGEIMSAIFTAFPTTAITHLDARKGAGLTQHTWSTALRALAALDTVYFQATDGHAALLDALADLDPPVRSLGLCVAMWEYESYALLALLTRLKALLESWHVKVVPFSFWRSTSFVIGWGTNRSGSWKRCCLSFQAGF
ncbi:hypothetical protein B0H17DRAFT_1065318 [Mycena rosella]|uniref:F-box domain-containing protein n=1 Tax=Mycena rosella TaxID=1033263 RepID=A0AAD7DFY2_MYCRO|nr:hypothetical protein B0H17DRAFT_1065318 [Mycena rosella]